MLESLLAVARSWCPSALKSPTARETAPSHPKVPSYPEGTIPLAQQDGHGVGIEIGHSQVLAAIAVEVADRDGNRFCLHFEVSCILERRSSPSPSRTDTGVTDIGDGQILAAIAIEVADLSELILPIQSPLPPGRSHPPGPKGWRPCRN